MMSSPLTKELRAKHGLRSLPIVSGDVVQVFTGAHKGKTGKVTNVYRKKWVVHIEGLTREKSGGVTVNIGVDASNIRIIQPVVNRARSSMFAKVRRAKKSAADKAAKME